MNTLLKYRVPSENKAKGNIFGIGWTLGWNVLGPWITNTEGYNNFFFGKNSARYQYLEGQNGWYESKILKL